MDDDEDRNHPPKVVHHHIRAGDVRERRAGRDDDRIIKRKEHRSLESSAKRRRAEGSSERPKRPRVEDVERGRNTMRDREGFERTRDKGKKKAFISIDDVNLIPFDDDPHE